MRSFQYTGPRTLQATFNKWSKPWTNPESSQVQQRHSISDQGHSVCHLEVADRPKGIASSYKPMRQPAGRHRGRWWSWCMSGRWFWSTLYTSAASPDNREGTFNLTHTPPNKHEERIFQFNFLCSTVYFGFNFFPFSYFHCNICRAFSFCDNCIWSAVHLIHQITLSYWLE